MYLCVYIFLLYLDSYAQCTYADKCSRMYVECKIPFDICIYVYSRSIYCFSLIGCFGPIAQNIETFVNWFVFLLFLIIFGDKYIYVL